MVFQTEHSVSSFNSLVLSGQQPSTEEIWNKYEKRKKVGEGTYAVVYDGYLRPCEQHPNGLRVAIKKVKMVSRDAGFDISAIREIKYLQEIRHANVVKLLDVFVGNENINLVLEYLDADLEDVIKDKSLVLSLGDIKSWMLMTLRGLEHCHKNWILHRDLKPNNLLLSSSGVLKLADFGLARDFGLPTGSMSPQAVTRWYRAPELLLGARDYGGAVDIWSVACIFAELMLRTPFIAGDSDMDQLGKMFQALGTPSESIWPGVSTLPDYIELSTQFVRTPLQTLFTAASDEALDLLEKMLVYDPSKRISAHECLLHNYFRLFPRPTDPGSLPKPSKKADRVFHAPMEDVQPRRLF